MRKKMWELFITFAKIGAVTFGGGYAMLALIEDECVEKRKWLTSEEMATITAIAEATPGPIAVNCATFTGYLQEKLWGAIFATLGMVTPSFFIIYLISLFFDQFLEITLIANMFKGIKIAVGVLIVNAAVSMIKKMKRTALSITLLGVSCGVMLLITVFSIHFSTIYVLLIAGTVNLIAYSVRDFGARRGEAE